MFRKRVAFVTGSAKGLGKEIALSLAKKGYSVIMHYYKNKRLAEKSFHELKNITKAMLVKGDLTNPKIVDKIFTKIKKEFERLDILINNVGNFFYKDFSKTSLEEIKEIYNNNVSTMFLCTKKAIPLMRKNKFGRIINFGCVGAEKLVVREKTTPYYAAKASVIMFSKAFAEQEKGTGITVNVISPGVLETSKYFPDDFDKKDLVFLSDIVNKVLSLVSENNTMTGKNFIIAKNWKPKNWQ